MEIKTYKKDAFYSYTLGAFPTLELIQNHKEDVLKGITVWYNNNNLKFLEELIKNDLDNTKSKTKEKQKTLTK